MSSSNAVGKLRDIVEAQGDPREVILRELGDLSKEHVLHAQVLVAIHPGSKFHPGTTLLRTDKSLLEMQYQGSVGLVVKMGPRAYTNDERMARNFDDSRIEVGDWVMMRPSDGLSLYVNQVPCRLFEDVDIKMRITKPEAYW